MRTPRQWKRDKAAQYRAAQEADYRTMNRCKDSCQDRYPGNSYECEKDCTRSWLGV